MDKVKKVYQSIVRKPVKKKISTKKAKRKKAIPEAVSDGYEKILQDWMAESIKPSTRAAEEAMLKVFESDTPQSSWSYAEWAVYITRAIMHRADCVSIYDLYLLHEIMTRCQEDVS